MESFVTSLRLVAAPLLVCVGVLEPNLAPDRQ